jgi:hypothetical protein
MEMIAGTDIVFDDDPCFYLAECNIMSPMGQWHRYEVIDIIRNWMPTQYRRDMGLASEWEGIEQFGIIGGMLDEDGLEADETVGSMREMAHQLRGNPAFDIKELVGRE